MVHCIYALYAICIMCYPAPIYIMYYPAPIYIMYYPAPIYIMCYPAPIYIMYYPAPIYIMCYPAPIYIMYYPAPIYIMCYPAPIYIMYYPAQMRHWRRHTGTFCMRTVRVLRRPPVVMSQLMNTSHMALLSHPAVAPSNGQPVTIPSTLVCHYTPTQMIAITRGETSLYANPDDSHNTR